MPSSQPVQHYYVTAAESTGTFVKMNTLSNTEVLHKRTSDTTTLFWRFMAKTTPIGPALSKGPSIEIEEVRTHNEL
jgi:hypothetical protein